MNFHEIAEVVDAEVKKYAVFYSRETDKVVLRILQDIGVQTHSVPRTLIEEVGYNVAKDFCKLSIYHPKGVDLLKPLGFMCFWVRKIKPIREAVRDGVNIKEINELVSVRMMGHLAKRYAEKHPGDIKDGDVDGVHARVRGFIGDEKRVDYIIHCMRYRTFGPHHYIMLLQNIVHGF